MRRWNSRTRINGGSTARIPAERRTTLLAQPVIGTSTMTYRFDIVLQDEDETVFFAV